ncbi:MAG: hypothetical protein JWO06_2191 [Bacteroidota bacterium]|nr:hypothetical protein [Bacteroidota bacterium]
MLPSWLPVVDKNYIAIAEGRVSYNLTDGTDGPHLAGEDLPFCHYSHDVDFSIIPDKTEDNRFTNLLPYLVYAKADGFDTVLQRTLNCEWESGLAMNNKMNPIRDENDAGNSGGFFSTGHERGDLIWNWPGIGDWVHIEGSYVWDRGHPPAEAEIHPPRFMAIKRLLPDRVIIGDSSIKFATRVDVFACGDGGAVQNNRFNAPNFVRRVNMSSKDYDVTIKIEVPRPSAKAHLKYSIARHKADNFSLYELIEVNDDSAIAHFSIPWMSRNANDLEIYARTISFYWDEGNGTATDAPIDIYKVKFTGLRFKHLDELLTKAEIRLYSNVGSDWVLLNDFFPKKGKILSKGLGKTYKHKWTLNNEFTVYVPRGKSFRVYMAGWEVDGVDRLFGGLLDPNSPCNRKTKHFIKSRIFSFSMVMNGCFDDNLGETSKLHSYDNLGKKDSFSNSPQKGTNDDPCPGSKYPLKDRVFLNYTIEKVN